MPTNPVPFSVAELRFRGRDACPVRGCNKASGCPTHHVAVHSTHDGFTYVYDEPWRNLLRTDASDQERLNVILRGKREWLVVLGIKPVLTFVPLHGFLWLLTGGLFYTVGVFLFASKRIPYSHAIWHLFALCGSICHYWAVFFYVLPHKPA